MEQKTIKLLEFPKVLQYLSNEAVSSPGKNACLEISFFNNPDELDYELNLLRQVISCKEEYGIALSEFPDITDSLKSLKRIEYVLDNEDLWDLSAFLRQTREFLGALSRVDAERFGLILDLMSHFVWPEKFHSALKRCLGPSGEIKDQSSPGLYSVRVEMRSIRESCSKKVNESLTLSNISHYLQDEYLTISSDRYVLALKSNFKGKVQGIIHDYSQTGETCYFEPYFLIDLNNNLQKLKRREREELNRVLEYLTTLGREAAQSLKDLFSWVVRMDFVFAKARFAGKLNATPLKINEDSNCLSLKNVRHPLLELGGFPVVPTDIELEPGQHVLIVSGGNAGGKTVCLKTLGLSALMAMSALPVPADEGSSIPMWDKIFVSMVSEQSVEESLSTFTAQIDNFSRFWPLTDEKTLIILDEFGVGTDPSQGAALAQAVVDELLEKKAWVATATHFPALKAYALSKEEVRAASVLFDGSSGRPLYRLAYDQVGSSLALDVARKQGLAPEIIARAEKYLLLDGHNQEEIFEKLNRLAVDREHELESISKKKTALQEKYQKEINHIKLQKDRLVREIRSMSQKILEQWEQQRIGRKKALKELSAIRQEVEDNQNDSNENNERAITWESIIPGERLLYMPWNRHGLVQEKDERKKQLKIDLGGISLWVDPGSLVRDQETEKRADAGRSSWGGAKFIPIKIDLRGKYLDEALPELEQYLDDALIAGRKHLEVVHGKGTGALRSAVHDYLRGNPMVASFKCASEDTGGEGMTEVELS
ncbi:MAG: endonuclease MutS2 [Desulfonatronovibrio sp. MSAO_Bac4]|nr:MAG: endonuclease MutS2 [Desulfonatronovibrio sp. MSAO_Bac4]